MKRIMFLCTFLLLAFFGVYSVPFSVLSSTCGPLERNLSLGDEGEDVRIVQKILNNDPETQVAPSGNGSSGNETTFFGTKTKSAVMRFQEKYRADVLDPLGISAPTGFVGFYTRQKLVAVCDPAQTIVPEPSAPNTNTQAPVFDAIATQTIVVGTPFSMTVSATDVDGNTLTYYMATTLPEGASFNPDTRVFSWDPRASQRGEYVIGFGVKDGKFITRVNVTFRVLLTTDLRPDEVVVPATETAVDGSCQGYPTTVAKNGIVTWTVNPTGAQNSYLYSWESSGTTNTNRSFVQTFSTVGIKTASVLITSATKASNTKRVSCNITVTENVPPPSQSVNVITYTPSAGVVDHSESFAQAVKALKSGEVLEINGTVKIGEKGLLLENLSNITVRGKTPSDGFSISTKPTQRTAQGFVPILVKNCTSCIFEKFTVEGNDKDTNLFEINSSTATEIRDLTLQNVNNATAIFTAVGNINNKYLRNTIRNSKSETRGMWIGNANVGQYEYNPLISLNNISNTGATGIGVMGDGATITNNSVSRVGGAGIVVASYVTAIGRNYVIEGNTIKDTAFHGIQSDVVLTGSSGDNAYSSNIIVRNNNIDNSINSGIYVVNAKNWVIENNTIKNNRIAGITITHAHDITVRGNTIFSTEPAGDTKQKFGVSVVAQNGTGITNVFIENNNTYGNAQHGILVTNSGGSKIDGVRITGNTSRNNGGWGIIVADEVVGDIKNVTIQGNTLDGNVSGGIRNDIAMSGLRFIASAVASMPSFVLSGIIALLLLLFVSRSINRL